MSQEVFKCQISCNYIVPAQLLTETLENCKSQSGVILQGLQAAIIRQLHDTRDTLTCGNMRTSCAQKYLFSDKLTQNTRINKLNITAGFNYHGK